MSVIEHVPNGVRLKLRVIPRAQQTGWAGIHDGHATVRLTAPPADGKANAALCRFLAEAFGTPLSNVEIERGETGRRKRVRITRPSRIPTELEES